MEQGAGVEDPLGLKESRFGTVTLVIQDGKIIQIDRNEKIRIQ